MPGLIPRVYVALTDGLRMPRALSRGLAAFSFGKSPFATEAAEPAAAHGATPDKAACIPPVWRSRRSTRAGMALNSDSEWCERRMSASAWVRLRGGALAVARGVGLRLAARTRSQPVGFAVPPRPFTPRATVQLVMLGATRGTSAAAIHTTAPCTPLHLSQRVRRAAAAVMKPAPSTIRVVY